ncbi:MAG: MBL fold metallo-hydrolase [Gammaproteobacteria bacterium]|nr:MBL fold metallo-hydrolase [Gammaproteobacteria bacterium]
MLGLIAMTAHALPLPEQVSTHAWAWVGPYEAPSKANEGFRMNLGFIIGGEGVAVVDSGYSPAMANEMLQQIHAITTLPIRYVINTNSQPHRFMGNDVFRQEGASIIAATEAAERMHNEAAEFSATVTRVLELPEPVAIPAAPDRLIGAGDSVSLDLGGGVSLGVEHYGRTHTRGSLIVRVTPDDTVYAGDILCSGRLLSILPDGNVAEWISSAERLRTLKAKLFVPGHGKPRPLADFEQPTYTYLNALLTHMNNAVDNGTDITEAINSFYADAWKQLAMFEELSGRNASLTYLEREAEGF